MKLCFVLKLCFVMKLCFVIKDCSMHKEQAPYYLTESLLISEVDRGWLPESNDGGADTVPDEPGVGPGSGDGGGVGTGPWWCGYGTRR